MFLFFLYKNYTQMVQSTSLSNTISVPSSFAFFPHRRNVFHTPRYYCLYSACSHLSELLRKEKAISAHRFLTMQTTKRGQETTFQLERSS